MLLFLLLFQTSNLKKSINTKQNITKIFKSQYSFFSEIRLQIRSRNTKHVKKLIKVPFESESFSREEGGDGTMESSGGGSRGGGCVDGVNVRSQGARGRVISCESVNDT